VSSLELREVVKGYMTGEEVIRAVDGVSLTVTAGELVALYGPSGSGKTTLLLIAAGLMRADAGSVWFAGRDISRLTAREGSLYRRRDVGFVFQSFQLILGASALDNAAVKLLADRASLRQARIRALPWLDRVGLGSRAEHTPERLSMGERQRVAVARALVNQPRLLLADEPTGNLDSRRSRETLELLRDLCHENEIPGLLVTHDPQASRIADRVLTLKDGRLHAGLQSDLAVRGES
jgi:putative ABC transport system ATP-binding protein